MRQKVVIRAIVSQRDRVLLLKRYGGRPSISGLYELPGGSLHAGEQPIDALKRSLQIHTGIYPETVRMCDVISYIDPDDRELQYVFIVYLIGLPDGSPRITLDGEYSNYIWKKLSDIQHDTATNSTNAILELQQQRSKFSQTTDNVDDKNTTVTIYSDGGSRGNPGPSASAYIILDQNGNAINQGGLFLGRSDSGMAEYRAVELALEKAIEMKVESIEFRSDSLMVVNQINGVFSVKNPEFRKIHDRIINKLKFFRRIRFKHVHREYNRLADGLVNKILDDNLK